MLYVIFSSLGLLLSEAQAACPAPTRLESGKCVLDADAVLTETLELSSGTTLDCQGHRLTPSIEGQSSFFEGRNKWIGVPLKKSVPSTPTTGVLLADGTSNATVQNCVLDGFDFSVVIANSRLPNTEKPAQGRNRIINNQLTSRYRGVEIVSSDANEVRGNTIRSFAAASGGVGITHDSDDNLVKGNIYIGPSVEDWAPGPVFPGGQDELDNFDWGGHGVRVMGAVFSYQFRVGQRVFLGKKDYTLQAERNVIEENDIDIPNRAGNGFIADSLADGTVFRRNIIRRVSDGIACVGHASGANPPSLNTSVEGNTIYGPAESGILAANTQNPVFLNNTIMNAGSGLIIIFQSNATVTNNVIRDSSVGILMFAMFFPGGLHMSKNDFIGNGLQVEIYESEPVELSDHGVGNYWGHSSGPGWLASDTNDPTLAVDSFPSNASVATGASSGD